MEQKFGVGEIVFTDSGRTALKLCLLLLNHKSNRIALPAYTCPILFEVILDAGFEPVPVDVEYQNLEMNLDSLQKEASSGLDAVISVHLFGDPISVKRTRNLIRDIPIIEDCAQGIGAHKDSKPVGADGDFSIFSFGFGKTITGGVGGALSINNSEFLDKIKANRNLVNPADLSERLRSLFWMVGMKFGSFSPLYSIAYPFLKSRNRKEDAVSPERISSGTPSIGPPKMLSPCVCKVVDSQLEKLESIISERRRNARLLLSALMSVKLNFELSEQSQNFESTFTRLVIRVNPKARVNLEKKFLKNGIEVESPYMTVLQRLYGSHGKFSIAERLISGSLSLPIHNRMSEDKIRKITMIAENTMGDSATDRQAN
jgi:dTDP-4-amino-4,6-dideoxygalactose transaminase